MMYATTHSLPPKPVFDHFSSNAAPPTTVPIHATPSPVTLSPSPRAEVQIHQYQYAFCVQLQIAPGPRRQDILFSTETAEANWLHPPGCPPEQQLPRRLPFYQGIVRDLEAICHEIALRNDGCQITVKVTEPSDQSPGPINLSFENSRPKRDIAIGIWLSGPDVSAVVKLRSLVLQRCPAVLKTACIDLDHDHYYNPEGTPREPVLKQLRTIAAFTGTDVFVLRPEESKASAAGDPEVDASQGKRLRVKIYGDYESVEHAKTRVLLMIDDLMGQLLHPIYIEVSTHSILSGRGRKNVKAIESATRTAIYFPPPFPKVYGYQPLGATRRHPDEIFITGNSREDIKKAEMAFQNLVLGARCFVKDITLSFRKIDFLLLERLEEVKKVMEINGTFVQFPALGSANGFIRVQGAETLHIERTIRSIMTLAGQYYDANWWIMGDQITRIPTPADYQQILIDVSAKSGADVGFHKNFFEICGSDWAVRRCLELLNGYDYCRNNQYQVRVKIELANEHKEFVAGKKNGKINKIMGQANIHILFDGFNEYNFYIDVVGTKYDNVRIGLELVEQELPASMSFHVPDSYHKRIIGVGGQHIQTIMKKYSVFVKFSNAMERGAVGKIESEDLKVDNVVCRTPARNAANLELVKAEIMEMVQQVDADIVTENVEIPRLHHRNLIAQRPILDELEKQWSCSVSFPSTEMASDAVTIKGPEWQIPHFKERLLALIPESHQIRLNWSEELDIAIHNAAFQTSVTEPMKSRLCITLQLLDRPRSDFTPPPSEQAFTFAYTRNDAGGLQDAVDLLMNYLVKAGVKTEVVKGRLSRPKSDSFEDFAPFFESAVLQTDGPGSRLSGEVNVASLQSEPRAMSDAEAAFYNGDRRRSSTQQPPGSAGSSSSRASFHSRAGSLDSDWEKISSSVATTTINTATTTTAGR